MKCISKTIAAAMAASSIFAVGGLSVSAAWAASAASTNAGDSDATLQEIVVTASKLAVDVMHAPVAVTAINGDDLQKNHIANWNDLQYVVPGMSVQVTPNGSTFNIRGVGDAFNNPNISQGVPVYKDGVLVPLGIGDEPLWDIANVQVLRGPQGTLTGANSVGGAIFINEVNPTLNDTSGYAQVMGGNYHHLQVQGAATLPVSDTIAVRVGAYVDRRDSFSTNLTPSVFNLGGGMPQLTNQQDPGSNNMNALRGSVLFQPTDALQLLAKVDFMQNSTGYVAEKPIPITSTSVNGVTTACPAPGSYFNAAPSTWSQVPGSCGFAAFAPADPYTLAYATPDSAYRVQIWRESLEAKYQLRDSGPSLRLFAGYQNNTLRSQNENTASLYYNGGSINGSHEYTTTYEADLISAADQPLQWVVGAFSWYDRNNFLFTNPSFSGGPFCTGGLAAGCSTPDGGGIALYGANSKKNYAVFGNVQYQLNDKWKVEGGVRETWDRGSNPYVACPAGTPDGPTCQSGNTNAFHFFAVNPNDPYNVFLKSGANSGFSNWGEYSDHLFTWKAVVDYNLTPHDYLYGEIATGAKAGGIQNQGTTPDCHGGVNPPGVKSTCFQPEKDTDYEVGYKSTLLDGHATLQADVFYIKYNNMQVNSRDPANGQGNIKNAGAAQDKGVELAAQVNLAGWLLGGNASYTKSSFSLGTVVNDDACNLYQPCRSANNYGACPPGVANGGVAANGGSPCFNYVGGVTINGQFVPFLQSVNGQQLPNSPTFQGNITLAYRVPLSNDDGLTPRVDFMYQGKQYGSIFNTPLDQFGSRSTVNASLTWEHERWAVEAFATNLSNQVYPVAFSDQAAEILNTPRQIGLQVRWNGK